MNKKLILKYINIYSKIGVLELAEIMKMSKLNLSNHIKELEREKLIRITFKKNNKNYEISPTKLGREVYLNEKIRLLIENKTIEEKDSKAPYICEGCIYFKDKLSDLCEYIKCNDNKIYILHKK